MAVEDFTGWSPGETDPNSRITVTPTRVECFGTQRDEDARHVDDKGVNHFSGDFTHLLEVFLSSSSTGSGVGFPWQIANDLDDVKGLIDASKSNLYCQNFHAVNPQIFIAEQDGASNYVDGSITLSEDTIYYLTIERDESVGSFGDITCFIYSDSGRTTLVDTLNVVLHTSKKDFRYIYAANTFNDGSTDPFYGYSQNLDLQEAVVGVPIFMRTYRNRRT